MRGELGLNGGCLTWKARIVLNPVFESRSMYVSSERGTGLKQVRLQFSFSEL